MAAKTRTLSKVTNPGQAFVLPQLLLILAFIFWPLCAVFYYSTTQYDGLSEPINVGLDNFVFLATWPDFYRILLNNLVLIGGVVVWVLVPFIMAIAVFPMKAASTIRAILYIPAMLPPIIVGGVFRIVLADEGPVNAGLRAAGLGFLAPGWFTDPNFVLITVVVVIGWATLGSGVLFYSTGLAAISPSYIEAAQLDGVNRWQLIWHIYRPALRPITRFWILLLTISTVTGFFPWIYGLTQGGPGVASTTLDYAVYATLNQGSTLGRGAAIAVVSLVFIALIVLIQTGMRRIRKAEEWN
ncbi:sugar ABC transporter permease [uncultured Salinibacterium sp.]|uniref:carbohydrate ABC transporter permease n=1 Tax=uncultured Salinibacterium sp. TaxID=459274 RepID=UPI0030D7B942|tara:strand:- start:45908 stop:46801 length:894 start_codon:yes stop_codon:yes gene_type:complete